MNRAYLLPAILFLLATAAQAEAEPAAEAKAAAAIGDYREAAELYLAASQTASGEEATDYTLLAAEALLNARAPAEVDAVLHRLPPSSLNASRLQLANLLRARARLAQGDAAGALKVLPTSIDSSIAAAALAVRADALFASGDTVGGTTARVLREQVLTEAERIANRDTLWRILQTAKLPESLPNSTEPQVRGWIDLATLVRRHARLEEIQAWQTRNYHHPAAARLSGAGLAAAAQKGTLADLVVASLRDPGAETDAVTATLAAPAAAATANEDATGGFALLLPLSGPLASAAQAVRAGAVAAMNGAGANAPILQIHDTTAGLPAALAAALARDAKGLIGPLKKEDVAALAELAPALPVVALNYPDKPTPVNFVPFGLAPEDEARAAAEDAARANLRGALVLSLEGDWGERAGKAFREAFIKAGGAVVAEGRLKPNLGDYGPAVKPLLGITAAESRNKELAGLGINAELDAQPRSDLDVVFLALRGKQARLVVPQLRFHNGGKLVVYSLAAGSDSGSTELANVRICEAPWRQENAGLAPLRQALASVNPRGADTQRLFALGYDAYLLALQQHSDAGLQNGKIRDGLSGGLVLESGAVHRQLACLAAKPVNAEEGEPAVVRKPAPASASAQAGKSDTAPVASKPAAPAKAAKALPPGAAAATPAATAGKPGR